MKQSRMRIRLKASAINVLIYCCVINPCVGVSDIGGEKFVLLSRKGFKLSETTHAQDFDLYEISFHGRALANLYEGDNPDFPYDNASRRPIIISGNATLLSTKRIQESSGFTRHHLVEFSKCDGFCRIHVWYHGLTKNEADQIDELVRNIRRKKQSGVRS